MRRDKMMHPVNELCLTLVTLAVNCGTLMLQGWTKTNAFHVCITSYKLVIQDHHAFRRKKWKYFILDEVLPRSIAFLYAVSRSVLSYLALRQVPSNLLKSCRKKGLVTVQKA